MIGLSVDPALGGGHAMMVAELSDKFYVLDCSTNYDLSKTEEQLQLMKVMVVRYRPSIVIVEFDSQQKGLGNDDRLKQMSNTFGFTIRPHITRGIKADPIFGVASMDQSFKLGEIRIPYGDQSTQDRMAPLIAQLRAWRPDIQTKNLTQDLVMALWFLWRHWQKIRKVHEAAPVPAWRPSWMTDENRYRGMTLNA